jgi:SAM-dependent methyltransferase
MTDSHYLLENAAPESARRFTSLERLFDPVTMRHLDSLGVDRGWQCLEVGAGGGSIASWLSDRVGPGGSVLATDIDPPVRLASQPANVEVRQHDIGRDPLPEKTFDLVHARLVLVHVPAREQALARIVAALKPGGWLLIDDFDPALIPMCPESRNEKDELINKVRRAFLTLLESRGADCEYGRKLPRLLAEAGLTHVQADGHIAIGGAGSPVAELMRANIEQTQAGLVGTGLVTRHELERYYEFLDDAEVRMMMSPLISARGRRP